MRLHPNVENWERAVSVVAGLGLVGLAARAAARDGKAKGLSLAATGIGLIARGAAGVCPVNAALGRTRRRDDTRRALGGSRGVMLRDSISIARSPAEVFAYWRDPTRLPEVLRHIERVEVTGPGRTRWTVRGPGRTTLQWEAEIINHIEPELVAWRSLPGSDVASAGSVRFRPLVRGGTEVTVVLQYDAPGGKASRFLAWLAGQSPASQLREDLRRLKQTLEAGEVPTTDGQSAGARSALYKAARRVTA